MFRHSQRGRTGGCKRLCGLHVKPNAKRLRQILVQRLANQFMPEGEPAAPSVENSPPYAIVKGNHEIHDWSSCQEGEIPYGKARTQDGGNLEEVQRILREETQTV